MAAAARYAAKNGQIRRVSEAPMPINKKSSSKFYGIFFNEKELEKLFEKQGRRCYWLNIPLDPMNIFIPHHPLSISVDRLDNSIEYELDNIVISSRMANLGRGTCDLFLYKQVIEQLKEHWSINHG